MGEKEVIFYSTHCPKCKVLEKKLREANITYKENNDVKEMLSLGIKSAPYLSVNGKLMEFGEAVKWVRVQS